jgi:hypothetical protein
VLSTILGAGAILAGLARRRVAGLEGNASNRAVLSCCSAWSRTVTFRPEQAQEIPAAGANRRREHLRDAEAIAG